MKLKVFNSTKKEIAKKKYNIFIGVSMGIKPLNEELARKYIDWALKNTKKKVVVLIADEIAKFNYRAFSKYSENKSYKRAMREGDSYFRFFERILSKYPKEKRDKIKILRWKDIFDDKLKDMYRVLDKEFRENAGFRKKILGFVNDYSKRRGRKLDVKRLKYLSDYMLFELPTMISGIEFDGLKYKLLFYPTFIDSGMSEFVLELEDAGLFPKLKQRAVLVEAHIDKV